MITPLARSSPFQALNTERDWMDHMKNLSIHSQTYITWCMIRIYLGWAPVHRCLWCCCNSSQRWMSATISCHWRRLHLSNALSGIHCYCRGLVGKKKKVWVQMTAPGDTVNVTFPWKCTHVHYVWRDLTRCVYDCNRLENTSMFLMTFGICRYTVNVAQEY